MPTKYRDPSFNTYNPSARGLKVATLRERDYRTSRSTIGPMDVDALFDVYGHNIDAFVANVKKRREP